MGSVPKHLVLGLVMVLAPETATQTPTPAPVAESSSDGSGLADCLTRDADQTKTLRAGKYVATIREPHPTVPPSSADEPEPTRTCKSYVADFKVPANSTPPWGFDDRFSIFGSIDTTHVHEDECNGSAIEIQVYERSKSGEFRQKTIGKLVATWHPEMTPAHCVYTSVDHHIVHSNLPPSGTSTWRVLVGGGHGTAVVTLRRHPRK